MVTPPTHYLEPLGASRTGREKPHPQAFSEGKYQTKRGAATLDAALGDTVGLFFISSSAILSTAITAIKWGPLGTNAAGDIGFADDDALGIAGQAAALAADVDMAAAGEAAIANPSLEDWNKRVYELAGLDKDPRAEVLVQLTLKGANPQSARIVFEQGYIHF